MLAIWVFRARSAIGHYAASRRAPPVSPLVAGQ